MTQLKPRKTTMRRSFETCSVTLFTALAMSSAHAAGTEQGGASFGPSAQTTTQSQGNAARTGTGMTAPGATMAPAQTSGPQQPASRPASPPPGTPRAPAMGSTTGGTAPMGQPGTGAGQVDTNNGSMPQR